MGESFCLPILKRKKEHENKCVQTTLADKGSYTEGVIFTADDCPGEEGSCQCRLQAGWTGAGGDGARMVVSRYFKDGKGRDVERMSNSEGTERGRDEVDGRTAARHRRWEGPPLRALPLAR